MTTTNINIYKKLSSHTFQIIVNTNIFLYFLQTDKRPIKNTNMLFFSVP